MKQATTSFFVKRHGALLILLSVMLTAGWCSTDESEEKTGDDDEDDDTTEVAATCFEKVFEKESASLAQKYAGVDLLVMVDNSSTMAEEQETLTSAMYTLVNTLTLPASQAADPAWGYPAVDNMRVGVVTSNMGLQWGGGQTEGNTTTIIGCEEPLGQNAALQGSIVGTMTVASNRIKCDAEGSQCPAGFVCNGANLCESADGNSAVSCPTGNAGVMETKLGGRNAFLGTEAACATQQGTSGCGVEQQLEAAVRGIEQQVDGDGNQTFLRDDHMLIVLIVSDEEDCSIRDSGLFATPEWMSGANGQLNVACGYPAENETFLYPTNDADIGQIVSQRGGSADELQSYRSRLLALKNDDPDAVIFAAFVGVPAGEDSPCEGTGTVIASKGCLEDPAMQLVVDTFTTSTGTYQHFVPACATAATEARPGRRFVKLAEELGDKGMVFSICNGNWTAQMRQVATTAAGTINPPCFSEPVGDDCDLYVEVVREGDDMDIEACPANIYDGVTDANSTPFRQKRFITYERSESGSDIRRLVNCALTKIPAGAGCEDADRAVDHSVPGWYYCTNPMENFSDACQDGQDNDGDGNVDCADWDCGGCTVCGGDGADCRRDCRYGVRLTDAARIATLGMNVVMKCGLTEENDCSK